LNSEIQAAVASQKFPDSIGNGQGNSPETALPCPQISSNGPSSLPLCIPYAHVEKSQRESAKIKGNVKFR